MTDITARLAQLTEAAVKANLPAPSQAQIDFIVSLMAQKSITIALFNGQEMLTKRGASNFINDLKVISRGVC